MIGYATWGLWPTTVSGFTSWGLWAQPFAGSGTGVFSGLTLPLCPPDPEVAAVREHAPLIVGAAVRAPLSPAVSSVRATVPVILGGEACTRNRS